VSEAKTFVAIVLLWAAALIAISMLNHCALPNAIEPPDPAPTPPAMVRR
jgi:hypothetical protein